MDNEKSNQYYINKVLEHLSNISAYMADVTEDEFYKSKMLKSAICFEFIQIYENSKKITEEIFVENEDFPLMELRGFRNRLVHDYGDVDYSIILKTAKEDVPLLFKQINDLMDIKRT